MHEFAFRLAERRKLRGRPGSVTCVDKANVFVSMAFFRKVFDEVAARHPGVAAKRHYVDATALDLVRKPWMFDVMVTENMFGDILSAAMMLDWLAERSGNEALAQGAGRLERAVDAVFAAGRMRPFELGGKDGTAAIRDAVLSNL